MDMHATGSSMISAWGYDEQTHVLAVTFKNGKTYRYAEVPAEVAAGFNESESIGRYFGNAVRGQYEAVLVDQEDE